MKGQTVTKPKQLPPFHLALPVDDLDAARAFYGGLLGCPEGRSSDTWVDFNFAGHQFVVHLGDALGHAGESSVDGHQVPQMHFGLVLDMESWRDLAARLKAAGTSFIMQPTIRFEGEAGEQATMFLRDPAGNALEFKAMRDRDNLFIKD